MNDIKYNIELEVITPISIGAGSEYDWAKGTDYVVKDNKAFIIDIQKAVENGVNIDNLANAFLRQNIKEILRLLDSKLDKISSYTFSLPNDSNNPIKTFYRTQFWGNPVISGSSLKGAIRSRLFTHLKSNDEDDVEIVFGMEKQPGEKGNSISEGINFMRFIKIGDIEMPDTSILNSKIFNLHKDESNEWVGGWKHGPHNTTSSFKATGFNTLYECVEPHKKGVGNITIARSTYSIVPKNRMTHVSEKNNIINSDIAYLFKIINDSTIDYLRKELEFFKTYPTERTDEIIDNIEYLISLIPKDNTSCILKMSAGSGFHSITGDWKYKDSFININDNNKRYKSRKTIEYRGKLNLMGFVKLSVIDEQKTNDLKNKLENSHYATVENIKARIEKKEKIILQTKEKEKQKEEEKKQKELQKKAEEEAKILEEKKNNDFYSIYQKAISLKQSGKLKEALDVFKEAYKLYPERCENLIKELENQIKSVGDKTGTLDQFFNSFTFASPGAFAGQLKKRYKDPSLKVEDEIKSIADYIVLKLNNNPSLKKTWKNEFKSKFTKVIDSTSASKLYQLIFDKPLS